MSEFDSPWKEALDYFLRWFLVYIYNYRIYDRFRRPVASLVVLADESAGWHPHEFRSEIWGCEAALRFRAVKLLEHGEDLAALESNPNPFGLIVLAHLQSQATNKNAADRRSWKVRLIKGLLNRGMEPDTIRQFFRFIDWVLELPEDLELQFYQEIQDYTKEKRMPYISTLERWAMEKGREEGRE